MHAAELVHALAASSLSFEVVPVFAVRLLAQQMASTAEDITTVYHSGFQLGQFDDTTSSAITEACIFPSLEQWWTTLALYSHCLHSSLRSSVVCLSRQHRLPHSMKSLASISRLSSTSATVIQMGSASFMVWQVCDTVLAAAPSSV